MARCITVVLSLLLVAVVHASQLKTSNVRQTNTILAGYYPSDSLNLVTLGETETKTYVFVDQNCAWFEASYFCNAYGMDLVTIETQSENNLIMEQIAALGMNQSHTFWTAGHKLGRSTWAWMNGVNMTFWDWAPGHPVFPVTLYQCITLHRSDWYSTRCNVDDIGLYRRGIICEERTEQ